MKTDFEKIAYPTRLFTKEEVENSLLREDDKKLLIEVGLPITTPPNSLRFTAPASIKSKGLSLLSEEWAKFKNSQMAKICVVIASDSNGNSLFINTSPKGAHQISFYDHDFEMIRYVNSSLDIFLKCMLKYLTFEKQFANNAAQKDDYLALAKDLTTIDSLVLANKDTFWHEMIFLSHI